MKRLSALFVAVALILVGCSSNELVASNTSTTTTETEPEVEPVEQTTTTTTEAAPAFNAETYTQQIENAFTTQFGVNKITDVCDLKDPTWHCFYDKAEAINEKHLRIYLAFPADITSAEQHQYAQAARLHTFNFVGKTFPDLATIVSYNNGVDSGTTYRKDVPLLNQ